MQEFQPLMFAATNPWLTKPLTYENGAAILPDGAGLGVTLDEERFSQDVDSEVRIAL